jgi:hypothetical protein
MLATSLVFGSFIIIMFFVVGIMVGWVSREYMMNYREIPRQHPELFDRDGNLIADEVVSLSVSPDFYEGFQQEYGGLFNDDDDDDDDDEE